MSTDSSFMLLLRLGFSLAVVLLLIWVAAKVLRARGGARGLRMGEQQIEVVERRTLGRRTGLVLVRVGGRALLVGATDQRVELVAALPHLDERDAEVTVVDLAAGRPELAAVPSSPAEAVFPADGVSPTEEPPPADLVAARPATPPRPDRPSFADAIRELTVRRS